MESVPGGNKTQRELTIGTMGVLVFWPGLLTKWFLEPRLRLFEVHHTTPHTLCIRFLCILKGKMLHSIPERSGATELSEVPHCWIFKNKTNYNKHMTSLFLNEQLSKPEVIEVIHMSGSVATTEEFTAGRKPWLFQVPTSPATELYPLLEQLQEDPTPLKTPSWTQCLESWNSHFPDELGMHLTFNASAVLSFAIRFFRFPAPHSGADRTCANPGCCAVAQFKGNFRLPTGHPKRTFNLVACACTCIYICTHYMYVYIYIHTHIIYTLHIHIIYIYIYVVMVWSDTRQYQPIQYYTRWYAFWIQYNTR